MFQSTASQHGARFRKYAYKRMGSDGFLVQAGVLVRECMGFANFHACGKKGGKGCVIVSMLCRYGGRTS